LLHYKPISVDHARMQYFQAVDTVRFAETGIERDKAKTNQRQDTHVLQNA